MNHNSRPKETLEKALALNLNPARYGTFAEIGAGQEVVLQQEALSIVGVNLVYGAFEFHASPEDLLASLLDGLSIERVEIDMVDFSGVAFESVDNRIMSLRLVQLGLSEAAMFSPDGKVLQASEVLRKRPVLVERGSFRPVTKVNVDMFRCAQAQFLEAIRSYREDIPHIFSSDVLNLIREGDSAWEEMVPEQVVAVLSLVPGLQGIADLTRLFGGIGIDADPRIFALTGSIMTVVFLAVTLVMLNIIY